VARKLIVFDCEGAKVLEVSDLAQLDKLVKGCAAIAIIEGDVVALGTLELREARALRPPLPRPRPRQLQPSQGRPKGRQGMS
jgi:hypothetical protein